MARKPIDDKRFPETGLAAIGLFVYDESVGKWVPLSTITQNDGTAAILVSGAGVQPSATALKIVDGAVAGRFAKVDVDGNLYVFNLDIALSALRDALRGAASKTLSDVWSELDSGFDVSLGALRDVLTGKSPFSKVAIWTDVKVSPDTSAAFKLRYLCVAPPGTALTTAGWSVRQLTWSRIAADNYKLTSERVNTGISLLATGTDSDPWNAVKTRLDALVWSL